jgi:hypothetical protein
MSFSECLELNKEFCKLLFVTLLQAIQEQMTFHGQEPVPFEDVKDEIFDMVRPADPYRITLQDLLSWWVWTPLILVI